jgi:dihydrodipicolinate reductase
MGMRDNCKRNKNMHITVIGIDPINQEVINILRADWNVSYSIVNFDKEITGAYYPSLRDYNEHFKVPRNERDEPHVCIDFCDNPQFKENITFYAEHGLNAVIGKLTFGYRQWVEDITKQSGITIIHSRNFSITEQMFIAANKILATVSAGQNRNTMFGTGQNMNVMLCQKVAGGYLSLYDLGCEAMEDIGNTPNFSKSRFSLHTKKGFLHTIKDFLHPKKGSLHTKKGNDKTDIPVYLYNNYKLMPEHKIQYESDAKDEIILSHRGSAPKSVAHGAVDAAKRINKLKPGFYDYNQLIMDEAIQTLTRNR